MSDTNDDIQRLKEATREAHELLKDLKQTKKEIDDYLTAVKNEYALMINNFVLGAVEDSIKKYGETVTKATIGIAEDSRKITRESVKKMMDETSKNVLEYVAKTKKEIDSLKREFFDGTQSKNRSA
jgi:hypothetical protein